MQLDIYSAVERKSGPELWNKRWILTCRPYLPGDDLLGACLAGVNFNPDLMGNIKFISPRGIPEDYNAASYEEDSLIIDNEAANLDIENYVSEETALSDIESGHSIMLDKAEGRVTHPGLHSHTWLTLPEYTSAVINYKNKGGEEWREVLALVEYMKSLEKNGLKTRLVLYFGN